MGPDALRRRARLPALARGYARFLAGRLGEADAEAARGCHDAVAAGDRWLAAQCAGLRGRIAALAGDLVLAERALREANRVLGRDCATALAAVLAMAGDRGAAEQWSARTDTVELPAASVSAPLLGVDRAWATTTAELALAAAAQARDAGRPAMEALARYTAVRLGGQGGSVRLRQLADQTGAAIVAAYAASTEAVERRNGAALAEVAGIFDRLGSPLLAAEALALACRSYCAGGDEVRATRSAETARTLLLRCPRAGTPLLRGLDSAPTRLTTREREIGTLAARRLTSPQIAARLWLSVRTIDNHLARVYAKLGVSGRAELAAVL